jgi:hypothetical protein
MRVPIPGTNLVLELQGEEPEVRTFLEDVAQALGEELRAVRFDPQLGALADLLGLPGGTLQ